MSSSLSSVFSSLCKYNSMLCQVLVKLASPSRALTVQYHIVLVNITLAAQWAPAHLARFVGLATKAPLGVRLFLDHP